MDRTPIDEVIDDVGDQGLRYQLARKFPRLLLFPAVYQGELVPVVVILSPLEVAPELDSSCGERNPRNSIQRQVRPGGDR